MGAAERHDRKQEAIAKERGRNARKEETRMIATEVLRLALCGDKAQHNTPDAALEQVKAAIANAKKLKHEKKLKQDKAISLKKTQRERSEQREESRMRKHEL